MKKWLRFCVINILYVLSIALLTACGGGATSYTVSTSAGANGAISPASATVNHGDTTSFTVTPDVNYSINSVSGCGGSLSGNTYTTGAITVDCTVNASFSANGSSYTVSTNAGAGGAINPASTAVDHGNTASFTITPDSNYSIGSVSGCGGSLSGNTYTTGAITADCTVNASFSVSSYTVSTNAGANGAISPASATVNHGDATSFTVTPDSNYSIDSVSGCGGSLTGNTYTTGAITADCVVNANFSMGGGTGSAYLFYSGLLNLASSDPGILNAVDPANPTSPIVVEAGADAIMGSIRTFRSGAYNGAMRTLTDLHPHALIYAKTDGRFYRVSALKSGSLAPVQVSSENAADQVCITNANGGILLDGSTVITDFANPENSRYAYSLPGIDSVCGTGDDEWKMVRLGMSASDAPVTAKPPITALTDAGTGAVSGWVVNDAGALKNCDANFNNCSAPVVSIANSADLRLNIDVMNKRYLMEIDDQLFVYNAATTTLSPPLFTIPGGTSIGSRTANESTFYFVYDTWIYHAPLGGSAAATVLVTEADPITTIDLSTNKVIYQVGSYIKAVDNTGGMASTLTSAANGENVYFSVAGDYIYYSISSGLPIPNSVIAGMVNENGGNRAEFANAAWVGSGFSSSVDLSQAISLFDEPKIVILAETSGNGFSGATLKSFDAATGVEGVTLGTLPASDDISTVGCFGTGSGDDNVLCSATVNITPAPPLPALPFQGDLFFLNVAAPNSLVRVTDTENENEGPVYW